MSAVTVSPHIRPLTKAPCQLEPPALHEANGAPAPARSDAVLLFTKLYYYALRKTVLLGPAGLWRARLWLRSRLQGWKCWKCPPLLTCATRPPCPPLLASAPVHWFALRVYTSGLPLHMNVSFQAAGAPSLCSHRVRAGRARALPVGQPAGSPSSGM